MAAQSNLKPSADIRLATPADTATVIAIVNAAFAIETFLDGPRIDEESMTEMMRKGEFLVAEDAAGRIVATIYAEARGERGYFGMLAVDVLRQGKGLGRMMVNAAEEHCRKRGCKFMDLTVLSLRPELPPFYRKLGYAETGTQAFHPPRPLKDGVECHCIVMSKPLSTGRHRTQGAL